MMRMYIHYLFVVIAAGLSGQTVLADTTKPVQPAADPSEARQNIRAGLKALSPDIEVDRIRPAPVDGLYEVVIGTDVVYMTADGRYVLRGELLDLQEQRNVSETVRAGVRQEVLSKLSTDDMIRFSNGSSKHLVYVFTDTDCAYCRKLHQDVPYLVEHGVEVRYLAYPRDGIDSETYKEMEAVWCAEDRKAALTRAKQGEKIKSRECTNPVAAQYKTGRTLGVRGTPAIFLENGRELPGYVPPKKLMAILNSGS